MFYILHDKWMYIIYIYYLYIIYILSYDIMISPCGSPRHQVAGFVLLVLGQMIYGEMLKVGHGCFFQCPLCSLD